MIYMKLFITLFKMMLVMLLTRCSARLMMMMLTEVMMQSWFNVMLMLLSALFYPIVSAKILFITIGVDKALKDQGSFSF